VGGALRLAAPRAATTLDVYCYENSICAERVLMTLAEKGVDDRVPHHVSLFRRDQHSPEHRKLNPKAQVPTLVHDGVVIRESSLICDSPDEIYPDPPLTPTGLPGLPRSEALQRPARMREWIKECDEAGYQGVASLSFTAVFRERLGAMPAAEREASWPARATSSGPSASSPV
jgi:glutathione S-transferase